MNHIRVAAASGLILTVFLASASAGPAAPEPVSPGAAQEWARVAGPCPAFSWAGAPGEGPLELTVYRYGEDDEPTAVVRKTLPGTAQSWTPSLSECLEPGASYAWSLHRAGDEPGPWSETFLFEVAEAPSGTEVSEAIGIIQRYLAESGDAETAEALEPLTEPGELDAETAESVRRALAERAGRADADARRGKARKPAPAGGVDIKASATIGTKSIGEPAIIRGANQETSGVNYGVAGEASSPDGAALAASNLGGGADVALLDPDNPPGYLSESGLVFDDASDVFFDFENVGGGGVMLRQDGTELVTTATDQDTLGALSCNSGEVAKWNGSTWSCAADHNTDTTYDAGTGLDLTDTTFSLDTAFTDDRYWQQGGNAGTDPAADFLGTTDATAFVLRVDNSEALRVVPSVDGSFGFSPNLIGGHPANEADDSTDNDPPIVGAVIGGGGQISGPNTVGEDFTTVGGGRRNTASGFAATVGGGEENTASDFNATVGGGDGNTASNNWATVGGGDGNTASDFWATVGGGNNNTASGSLATVPGGNNNTASGARATVGGGDGNTADGNYSFAAGRLADTNGQDGAFVWGDSSPTTLQADAADQVVFQAGGGMKVYSSSDLSTGVELASGSGSWSSLSSRSAKANLEPVPPRKVLAAVAGLDLATWRYRAEDRDVRHMGPMAEDFFQAFGLGHDRRQIASVDADGVALAAIQGLHAELQSAREDMAALAERNDTLARRNDELAERLATLEAMIKADENSDR